jgi:hypothetical protein
MSIGAGALDELVWEELSTRLQNPDLVREAYRACRIHRKDRKETGSSEQVQKLATQVKLAWRGRGSRMPTKPVRLKGRSCRSVGDWWMPSLTCSTEKRSLWRRWVQNKGRKAMFGLTGRGLVSSHLQHFSFEEKQRL